MDIHPNQINAFTQIVRGVQTDMKDLIDTREDARWDDGNEGRVGDPDIDVLAKAVATLADALDDLANGRFDDGSDF